MSALLSKHLDALAASLQLALAQVDATRHALTIEAAASAEPEPPTAPALPAACQATEPDQCAKRSPEAIRELMGGQKVCIGCGCFAAVAALNE